METRIFEKGSNMKSRLKIPKSGFQIKHRPIVFDCGVQASSRVVVWTQEDRFTAFDLKQDGIGQQDQDLQFLCVCVSRNLIATTEFLWKKLDSIYTIAPSMRYICMLY